MIDNKGDNQKLSFKFSIQKIEKVFGSKSILVNEMKVVSVE